MDPGLQHWEWEILATGPPGSPPQLKFFEQLYLASQLRQLCPPSLPVFCCCCCCSVIKSYLTLCDLMDCSTPGFPVLYYLCSNSCPSSRWLGGLWGAFGVLKVPEPWTGEFTACNKPGKRSTSFQKLESRPAVPELMRSSPLSLKHQAEARLAASYFESISHQYTDPREKTICLFFQVWITGYNTINIWWLSGQ